MDTYLKINPEEFTKFKDSVKEEPVIMLNLLRYKETVLETGETGKEAYNTYLNCTNIVFWCSQTYADRSNGRTALGCHNPSGVRFLFRLYENGNRKRISIPS